MCATEALILVDDPRSLPNRIVGRASDEDTAIEAFGNLGFRRPKEAIARLAELRDSSRYQQLPSTNRSRLDAVGPRLLDDKALNVGHERIGLRGHPCGRSKALTQVAAQVPHDPTDALQLRHVDVEVHAVDALTLQHDVVAQDFADAVW